MPAGPQYCPLINRLKFAPISTRFPAPLLPRADDPLLPGHRPLRQGMYIQWKQGRFSSIGYFTAILAFLKMEARASRNNRSESEITHKIAESHPSGGGENTEQHLTPPSPPHPTQTTPARRSYPVQSRTAAPGPSDRCRHSGGPGNDHGRINRHDPPCRTRSFVRHILIFYIVCLTGQVAGQRDVLQPFLLGDRDQSKPGIAGLFQANARR